MQNIEGKLLKLRIIAFSALNTLKNKKRWLQKVQTGPGMVSAISDTKFGS